jgi:carnosine N-methyltransferase
LQIVAHLVRDWTRLGTNLRRNLYGWCRQQLNQHVHNNNNNNNTSSSSSSSPSSKVVFVPGAGMGRLSFDIWQDGYTVEANELSPVMAAAAHGILQRNIQGTIHPFVLDTLANEVNVERRYDSVKFPDVSLPNNNHNNNKNNMDSHTTNNNNNNNNNTLSFTIGDFVGGYYASQSNVFDAVVTCFFIDTATNIYDYIHLIHNLLKPKGGVWVNVGPVQWHGNAILRPSVDELRDLLETIFDIVHWSVDTEPIPYRQDEGPQENDDGFVRSTDFSSYRPLRFVAIRR